MIHFEPWSGRASLLPLALSTGIFLTACGSGTTEPHTVTVTVTATAWPTEQTGGAASSYPTARSAWTTPEQSFASSAPPAPPAPPAPAPGVVNRDPIPDPQASQASRE